MINKEKYVSFVEMSLKISYEKLKEGKFEDKNLYKSIEKAIDNLKQDPEAGTHIPKKQIPKEYIQNYGVTNLWKYDLPNAWRLVYTILGDEVKIVSMILEWMTHKEYDRRFNY